MTYRILIVEDDQGIAEGIRTCVRGWGMEAKAVEDFGRVSEEFDAYQPHLVLMDITLPFQGGYYWCREIRRRSAVPILFISSASDNLNMVMAMNMGGDDFVAKPFDTTLLIAKIQALLRRTYDYAQASPVLEYRGARLNTADNTVTYGGEKLELSKNEYRILLTLMQNIGKIVSREKLMEVLWETDSFIDENTLTVNVGRLRKRLASVGLEDLIATRFGVGYIIPEEA